MNLNQKFIGFFTDFNGKMIATIFNLLFFIQLYVMQFCFNYLFFLHSISTLSTTIKRNSVKKRFLSKVNIHEKI